MEFPKPPISNRQRVDVPEPQAWSEPVVPKMDTALTDDETTFILDKYLRQDQRLDKRVLTFIHSYLQNRNAAQAARDAGMPGKGPWLRSRPEIHAVLEAITQKAVMKYGYDAAETIEKVKEVASVDPIEFENPDGTFKTHLSQIAPEARRAIKKFKCKNIYGEDPNGMKTVIGQLIEVELYDKLKAVEMLGSEKDLFKKTTVVQHDVTKNMAATLLESSRRADQAIAARPVLEIEGKVETDETS